MHIDTTPFLILKRLLFIIALLFLGNIIAAFIKMNIESDFLRGVGVLFDFDREANIPTFFSSTILLSCAVLLFYIYRKSDMKKIYRLQWLLLSLIFTFLGLDEFAIIHEKLIDIMRYVLNPTGIFFYGWILPYGIAVALLGVLFIPFLGKLPVKIRTLFLSSAVIFLLGAVGMEMIGGAHAEVHGIHTLNYAIFYSIEELLEMLGIALFLFSLLTYFIDFISVDFIKVTINSSPAASDTS